MDTLIAFELGQANRYNELNVFDWDKAAEIIKETGAKNASAGLSSDLEWTEDDILTDGKPTNKDDSHPYLASTWAIPVLIIDGEEITCFLEQGETDGWDADTFWPESAIKILEGV